MKRTRLLVPFQNPGKVLLPFLVGRVFHVTLSDNIPAIEASGAIRSNPGFDLKTTFGSSQNSYFRKLGCVSLFDLRDYSERSESEVEFSLLKCSP